MHGTPWECWFFLPFYKFTSCRQELRTSSETEIGSLGDSEINALIAEIGSEINAL